MKATSKFQRVEVSPQGSYWDFKKEKTFTGKFIEDHSIKEKDKKGKITERVIGFKFAQCFPDSGEPTGYTYLISNSYQINAFLETPFGKSKKIIKDQSGLLIQISFEGQKPMKGRKEKINIFNTAVLVSS